MAVGTLSIAVGQHGNVTLNPTQSSVSVVWPGAVPVWTTNSANVALVPDPNTGLSCDVLGAAVGSATVTVVGKFGSTPTTLTSTVNVTVIAATPAPDALGLAISAVPFPATPRQP